MCFIAENLHSNFAEFTSPGALLNQCLAVLSFVSVVVFGVLDRNLSPLSLSSLSPLALRLSQCVCVCILSVPDARAHTYVMLAS